MADESSEKSALATNDSFLVVNCITGTNGLGSYSSVKLKNILNPGMKLL